MERKEYHPACKPTFPEEGRGATQQAEGVVRETGREGRGGRRKAVNLMGLASSCQNQPATSSLEGELHFNALIYIIYIPERVS